MKETVEHNNRFYTNEKGEIKTENEQLKEWLIIANKEIERLNKVLKYLELYFSNREDYELSQLVRDTKQANIEWLDKAIGGDKE